MFYKRKHYLNNGRVVIMVFVGGVHGVGKSYFTKKITKQYNVKVYAASVIIANSKEKLFDADKRVTDIGGNQNHLIRVVEELNASEGFYLLDGHFSLLNRYGVVERINLETFTSIKPAGIIVLTEAPHVIAERRKLRDGVDYDIQDMDYFQTQEVVYARKIAQTMDIPILINEGSDNIEYAIEFIDLIKNKGNLKEDYYVD